MSPASAIVMELAFAGGDEQLGEENFWTHGRSLSNTECEYLTLAVLKSDWVVQIFK